MQEIKVFLKAKNEWIAFLDSDDQWMPKKIELQVNKIKKSKNKVFLFILMKFGY